MTTVIKNKEPIYVYVAGPMTLGDTYYNVRVGIDMAMKLLINGFYPYCPHLTAFWHMFHKQDYETWLDFDFKWIEKCDVLFRLPGESKGADREVLYAHKLNIPVVTSLNELFELYEK